MLRTALGRHISAARSIGPRAIGVRALSAGSFDGEMSYLYSKMFEQHLHPNGPWKKMVEATQSALGPSGRGVVLDLATGPGEPANMIARALPEATVIATDVSTDMVDKAKERMVGLKNVNFSTLDMQNMSSIESGSVDVVTACYGYMFPEDKAQALKETVRVLKPGGVLVATYWVDVQFLKLLSEVMTAVIGSTPPPPPANPMSLAESGLFDQLAIDAGFNRCVTEYDAYPFNLGRDTDFQYKLTTMLVKDKLDELDAHAVARQALFEKLPKYSYMGDNGDVMLGPNRFAMALAYKVGNPHLGK